MKLRLNPALIAEKEVVRKHGIIKSLHSGIKNGMYLATDTMVKIQNVNWEEFQKTCATAIFSGVDEGFVKVYFQMTEFMHKEIYKEWQSQTGVKI